LQFLVSLLETLIGPPSHPFRLRRERLAVECAAITADPFSEAVGTVDGPLVYRLACGGIHEAVALPASEIAPTKDSAAVGICFARGSRELGRVAISAGVLHKRVKKDILATTDWDRVAKEMLE
jgi:hypothetical protein